MPCVCLSLAAWTHLLKYLAHLRAQHAPMKRRSVCLGAFARTLRYSASGSITLSAALLIAYLSNKTRDSANYSGYGRIDMETSPAAPGALLKLKTWALARDTRPTDSLDSVGKASAG